MSEVCSCPRRGIRKGAVNDAVTEFLGGEVAALGQSAGLNLRITDESEFFNLCQRTEGVKRPYRLQIVADRRHLRLM